MKIYQNVPICPECKGMMLKRHQAQDIFYHCVDCMKILKVVDNGVVENELIVTDQEAPKKTVLKTCSRCNQAICVSPLQHLFSCPYCYICCGETEGCEHFEERIDK